MFNTCLVGGVSAPWKKARLALIPKGKDELPFGVKPLCMLDAVGKLYESIPRLKLSMRLTEIYLPDSMASVRNTQP